MFRFNGTIKEKMSLETLKMRLNYNGGVSQQDRMIKDKERSLKKAILYSYQSGTAVLEDGREFRCLMNPDKEKMDYDNKIISIPFKDICLNKEKIGKTNEGQEEIGMKGGDVFYWKETDSYWIVYLQKKEELAYFRAEVRRCDYTVKINGHIYRIYVRGPVETKIPWNQKGGILWNNMNYTLNVYITKNEETLDFFERFTKVKIADRPWEVQAKDTMGGDGIIELVLKEDFENKFGPNLEEAIPEIKPEVLPEDTPQILGDNIIYPFDEKTYYIKNASNGTWIYDKRYVKLIDSNETFIAIEVKGDSGEFDLIYRQEDKEDIVKTITIDSL